MFNQKRFAAGRGVFDWERYPLTIHGQLIESHAALVEFATLQLQTMQIVDPDLCRMLVVLQQLIENGIGVPRLLPLKIPGMPAQIRVMLADCVTPRETMSYKECGAMSCLLGLTENQRAGGVGTISAGNAGAGLAMAAHLLKVPVYIVVPCSTPWTKIYNINRYLQINPAGGTLIVRGTNFDEAAAYGTDYFSRHNIALVHPYDHPDVWAGQAANLLGLQGQLEADEIPWDRISELHMPVGGGGFASGVGLAFRQLNPAGHLFGYEPETHCKFTGLFPLAAPHLMIDPKGSTLADGTATRRYGQLTYWTLIKLLDGMRAVSEDSIRRSIRLAWQQHGLRLEGAGALSIAGLLDRVERGEYDGEDPSVVLTFGSGGNIPDRVFEEIVGSGS